MLDGVVQYLLQKAPDIPAHFWMALAEMAPYLLLGFLVAGILSVLISPAAVERHLGGRGLWPVLRAAGVGVPLPLCSCGVIPVAASLRRHGASRGATTAFLISTPQTGVDSIAVTYSMLGGVFAIFRPIAALISGVLGGSIVDLADKEQPRPAGTSANTCTDSCCAGEHAGGKIRRIFTYAFSTLPRDLAKALAVGLVVAALISALVPAGSFNTSLQAGLGNWLLGMLIMMALGIPTYVCATASVPMAAAMIMTGVSPGAAFAFLVTGPATNAATIATVWKVMGPRTAVIYLLTIAASALAGGAFLDGLVYFSGPLAIPFTGHEGHHMGGAMASVGIFDHACAVALAAIIAVALVRGKVKAEQVASEEGIDTRGFDLARIDIAGMTCSHCASSVERALRETAGVEKAVVDLAAKLATVTGEGLQEDGLRQAVESLGYEVKRIAVQRKDTLR
ncbi:MAG: SO_0444 family Cu/Zn efflux transporter [Phycisphaerae bacterium]